MALIPQSSWQADWELRQKFHVSDARWRRLCLTLWALILWYWKGRWASLKAEVVWDIKGWRLKGQFVPNQVLCWKTPINSNEPWRVTRSCIYAIRNSQWNWTNVLFQKWVYKTADWVSLEWTFSQVLRNCFGHVLLIMVFNYDIDCSTCVPQKPSFAHNLNQNWFDGNKSYCALHVALYIWD